MRKWMGNLIPAFFWLVPTLFGIDRVLVTHQLMGLGLGWLVLGTVTGWIALNQFGFYQNGRMKRRLLAILGKNGDLPPKRYYVGFSTPKYAGLLDAHEDVGLLCETNDALVFVSETRTTEIKKAEIRRVVFRANVHSIVGLGRWISIEAVRNGKEIRMLVEPREKNTMLGNLIYGQKLLRQLREIAGLTSG